MTGWTAGWLGWILYFAIEEGLALAHHKTAATLSGHIWQWFAVAPARGPLVRVRRTLLLAGLSWLVVHFLGGGQFV
jgi:hypothetical protein